MRGFETASLLRVKNLPVITRNLSTLLMPMVSFAIYIYLSIFKYTSKEVIPQRTVVHPGSRSLLDANENAWGTWRLRGWLHYQMEQFGRNRGTSSYRLGPVWLQQTKAIRNKKILSIIQRKPSSYYILITAQNHIFRNSNW